MSKRKGSNNDGRSGAPSVEETREGRMRMFDQLPKALRRFLSLEAPYDYAVTQFWEGRRQKWPRRYLTSTAERTVMQETAERYGCDHPQAVAVTKLTLKSVTAPKRRLARRIAVPRSYR